MEEKFLEMNVLEERLIPYGFKKENNQYLLKEEINESLYAIIILTKDTLEVEVREKEDDEIYLPYKMKRANGAYVSKVREKVDEILTSIYSACCLKNTYQEDIFSYCKEAYGTLPEYLFERIPDAAVLRTETKWYGILMRINKNKLGLLSEEACTILNVKNTPEKIQNLIDQEHYFKAYHMNKKYWVTILLDKTIDLNTVKKLIDESYQLVRNKKNSVL